MPKSSRIDINSLPLKYQQQVYKELANGKKKASKDRNTSDRPREKQSRETPLPSTTQIPQYDSPCCITVHCWKTGGNWDADNIETKCIIDSLVKSGIFSDDSITQIPQIKRVGHRCKTKAEERLELIIEEL